MRAALNHVMSLLGYVPATAKLAPVGIAIKFDLDSASLDATVAKLEQATAAADDTELALKRIALTAHAAAKALRQVQPLSPVEAQFATTELTGQEFADPLALAELRKQTTLLEVLAKQAAHAELRTTPATGAAASGLPG